MLKEKAENNAEFLYCFIAVLDIVENYLDTTDEKLCGDNPRVA